MVQALRRCGKEFEKIHGGIGMDIAGKIIEELRRSAKIGEMQGETLRLDRAEQISEDI